MIDKKANKQLVKGLRDKKKKPSWYSRYSRKKLLGKITEALKNEGVVQAWAHNEFVSAVERKPKNIVIYAEFNGEDMANALDNKMTALFPKQTINIIDVKTLLPAIKESIFKELLPIL